MKQISALFLLIVFFGEIFSPFSFVIRAQTEKTAAPPKSRLQLIVKPETALRVTAAAFSPDQKFTVTGADDGTICVWNNIEGKEVQRIIKAHTGEINSIAFAPDAESFVTSSADGTARIWQILDNEEQQLQIKSGTPRTSVKSAQILRHAGFVKVATFAPDGRTILTANLGDAVLWNAATGKLLQTLKHQNPVAAAGFAPNGKTIFTVDNKYAKLWDAETGLEIKRFIENRESLISAAVSPDGKFLAAASAQGVSIWETVSGKILFRLNLQNQIQGKIAFSPDGKLLNIIGQKAIYVYRIASGEMVRRLESNETIAGAIDFSPDGRGVLVPRESGAVGFVSLETGAEIFKIVSFKNGASVAIDAANRFDADGDAAANLEWHFEKEIIALDQLKNRFYEPRLLAKHLAYSREPLRAVENFAELKLYPDVSATKISNSILTMTLKNRGGGIGRTQIFVNDKLAYNDARPANFNQNSSEATLTIDLKKSAYAFGLDNKIAIVTSNAENSLQSRPTKLRWNLQGDAGIEPPAPKFYAVAAGVSDYAGENLDLRFAAKDAADVGAALQIGANRLFGKENVDVQILQNPTKANLIAALEKISAVAEPQDVTVIYLAGHGISLALETDTYFYLTSEAAVTNKEIFRDEKIRAATALSSNELAEYLGRSKALKNALILDTCAAGSAFQQLIKTRDVNADQRRALERLKDRTGTHILMGSAANAVSYEASQYGHSLLSYALLEGMKGAALRDGKFVDVVRLFDYAADRVPELSQNVGGIQRPVISSPSNSSSFDVGMIINQDAVQIPLQTQMKPVVLRPSFLDADSADDNLDLTAVVRKKLNEYSASEKSAFVFVDDDDFPGAVRPTGTYLIDGDTIKLKLALRRDGKTLTLATLTVAKNEPDKLAAKILESILEQVGSEEIQNKLQEIKTRGQIRKFAPNNSESKISIVTKREFQARRANLNNDGFSFVQTKFSAAQKQDESKVPLVTRLILKRKNADGTETADDMNLSTEVRKQIQIFSEKPGDNNLQNPIFLPAENYKGAFRPTASYAVDGKKIKVELTIYRDEVRVTDIAKISGTSDDLPTLAEMIVEMIRERVADAVRNRGAILLNSAAIGDVTNSKGRDYAVFFANDDYDHLTDLKNPVNDARVVAAKLKEKYGFVETRIVSQKVGDTEIVKTETVDDVLNEINELKTRPFDAEKDQLLIFISGHGDFEGDLKTGEGEGFMAVKQSKKTDADKNHLTYVSFDKLKKQINFIKCKHILLIIDSCFSGAIDDSTAKSDEGIYGEMSNAEYVATKMNLTTRKVLTAGGLTYTWDGTAGKHSPFVNAFVKSLDTMGDDDGILTTKEIYNKLEKLKKPTPRRGKFSEKDDYDSEFLFVSKLPDILAIPKKDK